MKLSKVKISSPISSCIGADSADSVDSAISVTHSGQPDKQTLQFDKCVHSELYSFTSAVRSRILLIKIFF